MTLENYVRSWARNVFRVVIDGSHVNLHEAAKHIKGWENKTNQKVDIPELSAIIEKVAEERRYIRR